MSATITRRALVAGAALAGVGIPMAAEAGITASHPDAELFALLDRFDATLAAWEATDAPLTEAVAQARVTYPPRPNALLWRRDDFPRTSYGRAASDPVGDSEGREYSARGVAWLRRLNSSVQWDDAAEARRQEIVAAYDAWTAERRAVDDRVGLTAASRAEEVAGDAYYAADDAVVACRPRTLAGLVRKAAWVAERLSTSEGARASDLGLAFARQVAAFGGAAS